MILIVDSISINEGFGNFQVLRQELKKDPRLERSKAKKNGCAEEAIDQPLIWKKTVVVKQHAKNVPLMEYQGHGHI